MASQQQAEAIQGLLKKQSTFASLIDQKGIGKPFFAGVFPEVGQVLEWLQDQPKSASVTQDSVKAVLTDLDNVGAMDQQIYSALSALTEDEPLKIVRNFSSKSGLAA